MDPRADISQLTHPRLLIIRDGDNMTKYTRQELRYLMGGDAKGPLK